MKFTGHQVQECGSAGDLVEDSENPVAEPSNSEESDKSKANTDGAAAVKMGDEIDSGATKGFLPPSPTGTKTIHSVATALDGTQVQCTGCGQKQKVVFILPKPKGFEIKKRQILPNSNPQTQHSELRRGCTT